MPLGTEMEVHRVMCTVGVWLSSAHGVPPPEGAWAKCLLDVVSRPAPAPGSAIPSRNGRFISMTALNPGTGRLAVKAVIRRRRASGCCGFAAWARCIAEAM
jgi:hypothetical protein